MRNPANINAVSPKVDYFYDLPGTVPGTLNVSSKKMTSKLLLIDYSEKTAMQIPLNTIEDCAPHLDSESISWLDVQGLGNVSILEQMGDVFHLHPLILEDIVNVPQRPKIENYDGQLVIITHMVTWIPASESFISEQVSFVLGKHYVLTVQEEPEYDCFDPIRVRIQQGKGII
ncbi:MAG: CorA family divalent cation transporter, partial [Leptolyngbyaceae bacterium]|nr:CorA family divalent cation transporter [Leptolyngbyaceae bacterium]